LLPFFRHQVNILLPDPDNNRPGYESGMKFAKSLIKRGHRVQLEDESCLRARFNLWLWQEHSRFVNESVKKSAL
jgi:hypothetical protein